jgi:hypothetical protein
MEGPIIPLYRSAKDRRKYDDLADLYAIIKATEHLEKCYARDSITQEQYTSTCLKLISQFRSTEAALVADGTLNGSVEAFLEEYGVDCPRAVERLLRTGVPATTLHNTSDPTDRNESVLVAQTVQHFITGAFFKTSLLKNISLFQFSCFTNRIYIFLFIICYFLSLPRLSLLLIYSDGCNQT